MSDPGGLHPGKPSIAPRYIEVTGNGIPAYVGSPEVVQETDKPQGF